MSELYTVYNRDFSDGYLKSDISQDMYIDNPRDHSVAHFAQGLESDGSESVQQVKRQLYDKKTEIIQTVEHKTAALQASEPLVDEQVLTRRGVHETVILDSLSRADVNREKPSLMVLIASKEQLSSLSENEAEVCYQLPSNLSRSLDEMVTLFKENPQLVPLFPAILIGDDFTAAGEFLQQVRPSRLITNNSGVGLVAGELNLEWIAGPQMNTTNSFVLKALKEEFGCAGAFISNELNKKQMQRLLAPADFKLYHSIYHPLAMLTSRQCLFQQSSGCKKLRINKGCLPRCEKHTSIINLKGAAHIIDKQKGEYNALYHQHHFLNTQVVGELNELYSGYLVDVRNIRTETRIKVDESQLIKQFSDLLSGAEGADTLHANVAPTAAAQYKKGL